MAALEGVPVAVALYDAASHAVGYGNPAYHRHFPQPPTELAEQVLRTGGPVACQEVAADDRFFTVSCSPAPDGVLIVAVDVTAQVVTRRREQRQRDQLRLLDRATVAVGSDLDIHRELAALADAIVPGLADGCAVYLPRAGTPGGVDRVAVSTNARFGVASAGPAAAVALSDDDAVTRAAQAGVTVSAGATPGLLGDDAWQRAAGVHTAVGVPVLAGDTLLAVIAFAAGRDRAPYDHEDIALMGRIAVRTRIALSQRMAHRHNQTVATALQRGMLTVPPEIAGLQLAVRYQPALDGMEVGGDWYDAFPLPGGGLGVAIGDVVGHDVTAAAAMGQLRSMLQALACQPGAEPDGVLGDLDRLTVDLGITSFATALYGRIEPGPIGLVLTWSNAGHPPPVLVAPDGTTALLREGSGTALGVAADTGRATRTVPLPPGCTLLLYTDGLIERPGEAIDESIAALAAEAARLGALGLEEMCTELLASAPSTDDVALLAARVATG